MANKFFEGCPYLTETLQLECSEAQSCFYPDKWGDCFEPSEDDTINAYRFFFYLNLSRAFNWYFLEHSAEKYRTTPLDAALSFLQCAQTAFFHSKPFCNMILEVDEETFNTRSIRFAFYSNQVTPDARIRGAGPCGSTIDQDYEFKVLFLKNPKKDLELSIEPAIDTQIELWMVHNGVHPQSLIVTEHIHAEAQAMDEGMTLQQFLNSRGAHLYKNAINHRVEQRKTVDKVFNQTQAALGRELDEAPGFDCPSIDESRERAREEANSYIAQTIRYANVQANDEGMTLQQFLNSRRGERAAQSIEYLQEMRTDELSNVSYDNQQTNDQVRHWRNVTREQTLNRMLGQAQAQANDTPTPIGDFAVATKRHRRRRSANAPEAYQLYRNSTDFLAERLINAEMQRHARVNYELQMTMDRYTTPEYLEMLSYEIKLHEENLERIKVQRAEPQIYTPASPSMPRPLERMHPTQKEFLKKMGVTNDNIEKFEALGIHGYEMDQRMFETLDYFLKFYQAEEKDQPEAQMLNIGRFLGTEQVAADLNEIVEEADKKTWHPCRRSQGVCGRHSF
jgi:hypothetical protein